MPPETQGSRVEREDPHGLRMRLGSGPDAAAEARRALTKLRADLDPPLMETLRLVVTELVTNRVRHTDCDSLTLRIAVGNAAVLTEVADEAPGFDFESFATIKSVEAHDPDTGWGLFLGERLPREGGGEGGGRTK